MYRHVACSAFVALLLLHHLVPCPFAGGAEKAESAPIPVRPVPAELRNAWPEAWEAELQRRGREILAAMCASRPAKGLGRNTYFENEKRTYGFLMAHAVAGDRETAIQELQIEDAQAESWHKPTRGIDYFACFTLKHQMRKYFLFGDRLAPEYRRRMFEGAKAWTEQDPLRRPHPAFVQNGPGWGPDNKNSWVDVRTTENLYLMRVSSVYLMAEETGNEATRAKYKQEILRYVASLYRVGMGEWDSENYHGHSIPPLLNLYDFARDNEVRRSAKAALDYVMAIGAVKYFHGAFTGPTKRDYNHPQPFGGSAACALWVYFGDAPRANTDFESDEIHMLTSAYRPPVAIVELARKNFARPVELLAAKPSYTATTTGNWKTPPEYLETQFIGRTFQMGSLVSGTTPQSDVNGFKIVVSDKRRGGAVVQVTPGSDPRFAGSAKYEAGKVAGPNQVAQSGPVAVWLVERGDAPWRWVVPDSISIERDGDVTYLRGDSTWIALHPLHTSPPAIDSEATRQLTAPDKDGKTPWAGHVVLSSTGRGGPFCGVAVEVAEAPDVADFAAFRQATSRRAKVDASRLAEGVAGFQGASGRSVQLTYGRAPAMPQIERDGKTHDLAEHARWLYRSVGSAPAVIEQAWLGGSLTIRAGKSQFSAKVDDAGLVQFEVE